MDTLSSRIVEKYITRYGLVRHQIESYDNFLTHLLPKIISEMHVITLKNETSGEWHEITLSNVSVHKPVFQENDGFNRPITPHLARLRSINYAVDVTVDAVHDLLLPGSDQKERRVYREVTLCKLPCMVGSIACHTRGKQKEEECRLDQGGYFIINGNEKVLISQEKLRHNVPYVFDMRQPSRYKLMCEIRSCSEHKLRSTSTMILYITNVKKGCVPSLYVSLPFMCTLLSLSSVFRMLGVETTQEVLHYIIGEAPMGKESERGDDGEKAETSRDNQCCLSISQRQLLIHVLNNDATGEMSHEDLMEYVGKEGTKETTKEKRERYLSHIVSNELLPHVGLTQSKRDCHAKAVFLGYMVRKLIRVYDGEGKVDLRDDYSHKSIDHAGTLMSLLFRQIFRVGKKSFLSCLQKEFEAGRLDACNVGDMAPMPRITSVFRHAFANGAWTIQKGTLTQVGVAQLLSRMTLASTLSNLRRINTPINREAKAPKPRQLNASAWGIVCPVETPEGGCCGLVKNLALLAHVRVGCASDVLHEHLMGVKDTFRLVYLEEADTRTLTTGTPVLINGYIVCFTDEREGLRRHLIQCRRDQTIPFDTSLCVVNGALCISLDSGCLMRPLLVLDNLWKAEGLLKEGAGWDTFLREGVIEYVDKQMESELVVALDKEDVASGRLKSATHMEIHPSVIHGICASLIPFPDHNQSPRNTYQSAMGKQAVSVACLNYPRRMDTISYALCEGQVPLVSTNVEQVVGCASAPSGVNVMAAIMCWTGFNQEDSVLINRQALERGLFRIVKYQSYREEEHSSGPDVEKIETPPTDCSGMRVADYDKLKEGVCEVGRRVEEGDVLIGKTVTTTELGAGARRTTRRDKSVIFKHGGGTVDAVLRFLNKDGNRCVKVRVRETRTPIVGDKVSSRCGQKGVIGGILEAKDMPFAEDGTIPDIIINPHAIPSRMTIGQLMECLLGTLSCAKGRMGDGTPFCGTSIRSLSDELEKEGFGSMGEQTFYSGIDGRKMKGKVFFGPTFYQRLKHMVEDKFHGRSRGPVLLLTRQPVEGRARDGGLRFGEMERDAILSHGAAHLLKDRLCDQSDPCMAWICRSCGLLAQPPSTHTHVRNKRGFCKICNKEDAVEVQVPFSFKLLVQEMMAMGIAPRMKV